MSQSAEREVSNHIILSCPRRRAYSSVVRGVRDFAGNMSKYRIVMVRHGESEWNKLNLFCGWYDANLSDKGA